MARLEELTRGAAVKGILPDGLVTIVGVEWFGSAALVEVPPSPEFAEGDAFRVADGTVAYGMPEGCVVRYVRRPFQREPDFGVTSVNYDLAELLARAKEPF